LRASRNSGSEMSSFVFIAILMGQVIRVATS
jgi:hypothetical protein